jgi:SMC interacting uncharacterized protein involved in chromosome segregation
VDIKKVIFYIGFSIALLSIGFFIGQFRPGGNTQQINALTTQNSELQRINNEITRRINTTNKIVRGFENDQQQLTEINRGLENSNQQLANIIKQLESGIGDAETIIEDIRSIIISD